MMNLGGYEQMMEWGGGWFGSIFFLAWIVWLVVGILLAVWLWQKITKE